MFGYRSWGSRKNSIKRSQRTIRSRFEPLEDRRLLTIFNVTTTVDRLDTVNVTLAHPEAADGTLSLREAIYLSNLHSNVADTVVLKAKSTYKITIAGAGEDGNTTGDFDVLDDLTIKRTGSGANPVIDGNGLDRVFDIPSTFDNISLTFNGVTITGGVSATDGGGVAAHGDNDALSFINTTVTLNLANTSGGGVFDTSGNVTLTGSHVDGNSARDDGGGIYMDGTTGFLTITKSTVNDNSAHDAGGGIEDHSADEFKATGSQINNNQAFDGKGGGAQLASSSVIFDSTIVCNNSATDDGGGVDVDPGVNGTITVRNKSTFIDNISGDIGGGLNGNGDINVIRSSFIHNTSTGAEDGGGGGINQDGSGDIIITGSTFNKNVALHEVGGAIWAFGSTDTITITDSKFTYNTGNDSLNNGDFGGGGAINAAGDNMVILRSTFDHNASSTSGGAISAVSGGLKITDSVFSNNRSSDGNGGVNVFSGDVTLLHSVFKNNIANGGDGGGLSEVDDTATVEVTNCTFSGNSAGGKGGGLALTVLTLTMSGSTVNDNRAGSAGGGMYLETFGPNANPYPDTVAPGSLIVNCTISGNGAEAEGGGFDFQGDGDLTLINDTIVFNATDTGGGIAQTSGSGTIHIGNTIVAKNIATTGPDIYDTQAAFDDLGHNLFFSLLGQGTAGILPGAPTLNANNDLIGVAPLLGALANNGGPTQTHALLNHSPAINAGDDALNPGIDQRGVKRPQGPHVDIGAYEKK